VQRRDQRPSCPLRSEPAAGTERVSVAASQPAMSTPIHEGRALPRSRRWCTLRRWIRTRTRTHLTWARQLCEPGGPERKLRPSAFSPSDSNGRDCWANGQREHALCPIHTIRRGKVDVAAHWRLTGFHNVQGVGSRQSICRHSADMRLSGEMALFR
jgi:hypothetical protein